MIHVQTDFLRGSFFRKLSLKEKYYYYITSVKPELIFYCEILY